MITRDRARFFEAASRCSPDAGPATARAAFLVAPEGFARAEQSASDNRYMADAVRFDPDAAMRQHRALQAALSISLPTIAFPGDPATPDAAFPNNVFATARIDDVPRLIVGRMRHPVRQREAERADIRGFFVDALGYTPFDLSSQAHPCELTGALVIDRARGIGFAGLSERCDEEGARRMHDAFGLRATFLFDLAPGEYHTNVVLAVLAGRAVVYAPQGFANTEDARTIASLYAPHAIELSSDEAESFAGNAIALDPQRVWMSRRADASLRASTRAAFADAGFSVHSVELDAIEAGGGSLRCCVAEIF
ncbi:amidinotransferase [Lysobacter sp. TY2-98]|uniref:arginine deiminase-related protein n=1 Tax=Lysobacter sp. TY2-98 TaxID=2290922 RepID=UPI000E203029|nr:arginine deiminase-related protein [Lysobacter sp. TY2-98]AXK73696.1 amidinotransferase [Lysobacter sp. TY2-98]